MLLPRLLAPRRRRLRRLLLGARLSMSDAHVQWGKSAVNTVLWGLGFEDGYTSCCYQGFSLLVLGAFGASSSELGSAARACAVGTVLEGGYAKAPRSKAILT